MGSATGSQRSTGFSLVRSRHEAWKPACWVSFAIYSERFEDWTVTVPADAVIQVSELARW